jgi:superfamily II DNA or RNA helicase
MITLRNYQNDAVANLRSSIGGGNRQVLLQAATGAGKTIIASRIIELALSKGKRVLFIAHRKEIINQSSSKLDDFEIEHGVIMANNPRTNDHAVQVASIQTLTRRDKPNADLVIIDECHLSCSASYKAIVEHYANSTIVGLTATPIRLDGKGLGEIYRDIIQVVPMSQLISEGHLVKPRVFAPFTPDLKNVRKSKGDYDASETAKLMDRKEITADIVKHWFDTQRPDVGITDSNDEDIDLSPVPKGSVDDAPPYRKTIVFASSVEHSKNIVEEFEASGISARHLDANSPANIRDKTLQEWRDGAFTVLSNMGLFIEGLDVPAASCCILARPTKSLTIYLQAVGRVMRPHESKTDCVILDCAGLTYEHGFVDDAREWTLDGKIKKPKDEVPAVHICESCFAAYSKAEHPNKCPECGFVTEIERKDIETADVEMVELTPSIIADLRAKRIKWLEFTKCKTLDDYIELGKLRGYKAGWAYHKWNDRKTWLESHGYGDRVAA